MKPRPTRKPSGRTMAVSAPIKVRRSGRCRSRRRVGGVFGEDRFGDRIRHRKRAFDPRSEEHTSELQSLMRISYAVFCLKKKQTIIYNFHTHKHVHDRYRQLYTYTRYNK